MSSGDPWHTHHRTARVLLAATVVGILGATPALAAGTAANVDVASPVPLVVHGAGFHPGEHVLVRVSAGRQSWRKTVLAGARGGFWARFRSGIEDSCSSVTIVATGDRGSRAVRRTPPPPCAEP